MYKHYYVAPIKRTKSQSSDASNSSETCMNDVVDGTASEWHPSSAASTSVANESHLTSCGLNAGMQLRMSAAAIASWLTSRASYTINHPRQQSIPSEYPQKRPPSGLTSLLTSAAFGGTAATASASSSPNPSAQPAPATGPVTATSKSAVDHAGSSATAPVRRWNSFHSTRGECHPNKFRRERKSTSPSLEYERKRYQSVSTTSTPSRSRQLRRGKTLATPEKLSSFAYGNSYNCSLGSYLASSSSSVNAAVNDHRSYSLGGRVTDDSILLRCGIASVW